LKKAKVRGKKILEITSILLDRLVGNFECIQEVQKDFLFDGRKECEGNEKDG
jgi:hypothetical protein